MVQRYSATYRPGTRTAAYSLGFVPTPTFPCEGRTFVKLLGFGLPVDRGVRQILSDTHMQVRQTHTDMQVFTYITSGPCVGICPVNVKYKYTNEFLLRL